MSPTTAEQKIVLLTPGETAQLEDHVRNRLSGRIQQLRVILHGPGLILRGHTHTYYAKQLAQHAVMEAADLPILANEIEVS